MPKTIAIAVGGLLVSGGTGLSVFLISQSNQALPANRIGAADSALFTPLALTHSVTVPETVTPFELVQAIPSESVLSSSDQKIFDRLMRQAIERNWSARSLGDSIQSIADYFLGAPYAEHLLDQTPRETLFVSLKEFDCVLFIETVLAMARGIAQQDYSDTTFTRHIQEQRYANGEMNGYCSRLHYFSQWIADNQRRGIVEDRTRLLGGIPLNKPLNFMSTNWKKYPKLVESEKEYQCIRQLESTIDASQIYYIPTHQIQSHYTELQAGDIIAIATSVPGLDVTHTGFVYRSSEGTGLIHAAPSGVKISTDLQTYVSRVDAAIGILVVRPKS